MALTRPLPFTVLSQKPSISNKDLADPFNLLPFHIEAVSLSIFFQYYYGHYSFELNDRERQPLARTRYTLQAVASHR